MSSAHQHANRTVGGAQAENGCERGLEPGLRADERNEGLSWYLPTLLALHDVVQLRVKHLQRLIEQCRVCRWSDLLGRQGESAPQ